MTDAWQQVIVLSLLSAQRTQRTQRKNDTASILVRFGRCVACVRCVCCVLFLRQLRPKNLVCVRCVRCMETGCRLFCRTTTTDSIGPNNINSSSSVHSITWHDDRWRHHHTTLDDVTDRSRTRQTPWHISRSMRCEAVPPRSRRSCSGRRVLCISVETAPQSTCRTHTHARWHFSPLGSPSPEGCVLNHRLLVATVRVISILYFVM